MMKKHVPFLILPFIFMFGGCATKKIKGVSRQAAQWETKAVIKNENQNKTQSLNIDLYALKGEKARVEISALLGIQVASLVMSASEISYIIYPQKTFYYGRSSDQAFAQMIELRLHPMNLINIAFEEPIRGAGWKCQRDGGGLLSQCENQHRAMKVQWLERQNGQKKVVIRAPQFEMQWHFFAPQTEVQFKSELFTLKQPPGFKAIQIN